MPDASKEPELKGRIRWPKGNDPTVIVHLERAFRKDVVRNSEFGEWGVRSAQTISLKREMWTPHNVDPTRRSSDFGVRGRPKTEYTSRTFLISKILAIKKRGVRRKGRIRWTTEIYFDKELFGELSAKGFKGFSKLRNPNKVDPTRRSSEFGNWWFEGSAKKNPTNANSKQSGPHSEEFRVRSSEKSSGTQYWKRPISEIRANGEEIWQPSIDHEGWSDDGDSLVIPSKEDRSKAYRGHGTWSNGAHCSCIESDGEAFARETKIERRETL